MSRTDHVAELAAELERAILAGELAPGDLLPSEREISAQRGVSRSVVREALGRLASLGLVHSRHGSGTRVARPNSRQVTVGYQRLLAGPGVQLEHLAAVRLPLETAIAALAAQRRTEEDLERMDRAQKVLGNPRRSLESHVEADLEFHAALADATGNPLFRVVLAPIQQLLIESRRRTLGRYGAAIAHEHHAQVLEAVRAGDADAAARAMRRHIEANFQHLHDSGGAEAPGGTPEDNGTALA
jgi:DNA-binding FadR family transcriptional regulator